MTDKPPLGIVLQHYGADDVPDWGYNRAMRCPFHDDAHKSASINVDKELFKCHTCGVQGDVYALVMQVDGVDFSEAKRRAEAIAKEGGIDLRRERWSGNYIPSGPWHKRGRRAGNGSRRSGRSRAWT